MRIIDPQSAVLTNVEVLAYLTANPPRRSPNPPPNADRLWVPSPDLRDHNTVVKEIHNYVSRISPHLLKYPRHTARPSSSQSASAAAMTGTMRPAAQIGNTDNNDSSKSTLPPPVVSTEQTPMDVALRDLISRLQPYGLTKAEVVMILNLGVGVSSSAENQENGDGEAMEVDETNGDGGEEGEGGEEDFGALALFESVVEEREARMTDEDVQAVLNIIREVLNEHYGS